MGWDLIIPDFPRPLIVDRFTCETLEGEFLPPRVEIEGLKIYRLILSSPLSEGFLDFAFEPETLIIHRLHNPNLRFKYVGKSLVEATKEIAKVNSCYRLRVNAINNSEKFYERLGFVRDEDLVDCTFEGIPMYLNLQKEG